MALPDNENDTQVPLGHPHQKQPLTSTLPEEGDPFAKKDNDDVKTSKKDKKNKLKHSKEDDLLRLQQDPDFVSIDSINQQSAIAQHGDFSSNFYNPHDQQQQQQQQSQDQHNDNQQLHQNINQQQQQNSTQNARIDNNFQNLDNGNLYTGQSDYQHHQINSNNNTQHQQQHSLQNGNIITISRAPVLKVVPPLNFCPVERHLYRSGQPTPINHSFLKQLNIRNIVWLASEDPTDDFLEFADNNDINVHYIGGMNSDGTSNPWDGLSENSITQALQIIANKNYYPILVCCGMGRHRTGTVIGCLRRLQGWNLASVSEEYRRFTGSKGGRILVELLIEAFDIKSIRIDPELAPNWLLS